MLKKYQKLLLLFILLMAVLCVAGCTGEKESETPAQDIPGLVKVTEFEGGTLYLVENLPVAQLNGNYHQMGRQYGALLKTQINSFYQKAITENIQDGLKLPLNETAAFAAKNYEIYPLRIKAVFEGMAETSGLTVDQLMLIDQNVILSVLPSFSACSQIAAWGDYTGDGPLVFGKNEDFFDYFKDYDDTLSVVVYNPDDGSASVASLCNAGQVSTMNAMNSEGIALAMNQAPMLKAPDLSSKKIPPLINYMTFLLNAGTMQTMDAQFRSYRTPVSFIVDVADTKRAISYECSQDECRVREAAPDGLLVATNHFADPSWILPEKETQSDEWTESVTRYTNLVALAEENKGSIEADTIMQILDTGFEDGGATRPWTVFQFVAEPAELNMWVKIPDYQDWVLVDVGELFTTTG